MAGILIRIQGVRPPDEGETGMFKHFLPVFMIVASNIFYNISTKSTPGKINPFFSLVFTYLAAAGVSLVLFLVTDPERNVARQFAQVNWTTFVLALCILGLELGYILLYRAGWDISVGSLVCNIGLAVALIVIGALFYKEHITRNHLIGILLCLAGLVFINL